MISFRCKHTSRSSHFVFYSAMIFPDFSFFGTFFLSIYLIRFANHLIYLDGIHVVYFLFVQNCHFSSKKVEHFEDNNSVIRLTMSLIYDKQIQTMRNSYMRVCVCVRVVLIRFFAVLCNNKADRIGLQFRHIGAVLCAVQYAVPLFEHS